MTTLPRSTALEIYSVCCLMDHELFCFLKDQKCVQIVRGHKSEESVWQNLCWLSKSYGVKWV